MDVVLDCLGSIEVIVFAWAILQMKFTKNNGKLIVGIIITIMSVVFSALCPSVNAGMIIGRIIAPMIGITLLFEENFIRGLAKYWFSFFYITFVYLPVEFIIVNLVFKPEQNENMGKVICSIIAIMIILGVGYLIKRKKEIAEWIEEIPTIYFVIGIVCGFAVSGINSYVKDVVVDANRMLKIVVESLLTVLSIFIYVMGIAFTFANLFRKKYKSENELKNQYLSMSKAYYNRQVEHMREVRSIKHDVKAHMNILYRYSKEKEWTKLDAYLQQFIENQSFLDEKIVDVGNEIINAIIMECERKSAASGNNIIFECDGVLSGNIAMPEYDLCTIFANLISNAMEACRKLKSSERKILIVFRETEDLVRILFENPIEWEIDVDKLGTYTSKAEKSQHGYGIANIKRSVSKHGGDMGIRAEDGKFKVVVTLKREFGK